MSAEPTAPPRTRAQRVFGESPTAWAFVLPAVVIIVGLSIVPIGWSLLLSFNSADLIAPGAVDRPVQLRRPALTTRASRDAIEHTIVYTVLFVPISTGLGLFLAMALNRRDPPDRRLPDR